MFSKLRSILLLVVLLLGGPVALYLGFKEAKDSKALTDHGVVAEAQVTEVTWSTKRGRERNFHAKITFATPDGKSVSDSVSVSNDQGKALRDQPDDKPAVLSVKYLPEDPHTVTLADHKDESGLFYGIGGVMLLVGLGMLVFRLRG